jgi:predicted NodU family carbamoyl transferase
VGLNCVAIEKITRQGPFQRVFVQPASSDAGSCLGAAAIAHVRRTGTRPGSAALRHMSWGPGYASDDVARLFGPGAARVTDYRGREGELLGATAERLAAGRVVGWFPILLETSFNLRGEPIVCTPLDALLCFIRSDLDCLVIEDLVLDRADLPPSWVNRLRTTVPRAGVVDSVYALL